MNNVLAALTQSINKLFIRTNATKKQHFSALMQSKHFSLRSTNPQDFLIQELHNFEFSIASGET